LAPGEYRFDIGLPPRGSATGELASVPVTVGGEDLTTLRILTGPPGTARGRVTIEGRTPRPPSLRAVAQHENPEDELSAAAGSDSRDNGAVVDDGSFTIEGIVGKVLFRVINGPALALKSVAIAGADVTDIGYDVRPGQTLADVQIVVTDRLSPVSGRVADQRGDPITDYVVVLLPEEPKLASSPLRFVRAVRPDQEGGFRLRTMPPGRYVVAALESIEQGGEWDPEVQRHLRDVGRRVTVVEGEPLALDLMLTPGL
jgi:hypothetical protein